MPTVFPGTPLSRAFPSTPLTRQYACTPLTRTTSTGVLEGSIHNDSNWQPCVFEVDYHLETVENPQTDSAAFRSISAETLCGLLKKYTESEFQEKYLLVDCRYPYEYKGGHIKNAINFHDNAKVHELFYPQDTGEFGKVSKRIPIFYCEFSQVRGPKMAHALRKFDRTRNEHRYPFVDYEEMYLLDRGYNNFYKNYKKQSLCVPDFYVRMNSKRFASHLKQFTYHQTRSQTIINGAARASIRRYQRRSRLQSTKSCIAYGMPNNSSTPNKPISTHLDTELKKWRDNMHLNIIPSTSEWDSTIEASEIEMFLEVDETPSPIAKISKEEYVVFDDEELDHLEIKKSPSKVHLSNSYIKPIQLSFSSE